MEIYIEDSGEVNIIKMVGKLDAITSVEFHEKFFELINNGVFNFIIDCSSLEYISSAGIRVFYLALKKIKTTEGKIIISSPNENLIMIFDMIDFTAQFPIV
ncbi:MAG: STAS domain-containing protein, partial [Bacteroidales bacterium]|nr:STAS domain-containing protein [Bacteroidales bacterium]